MPSIAQPISRWGALPHNFCHMYNQDRAQLSITLTCSPPPLQRRRQQVRDKKAAYKAKGGITKEQIQSKATPLTRRVGCVKLPAVTKKSIKKARVRATNARGAAGAGSSNMEVEM